MKIAEEKKKKFLTEHELDKMKLLSALKRETDLRISLVSAKMEINKLRIENEKLAAMPINIELASLKQQAQGKLKDQAVYLKSLKEKYDLKDEDNLTFNEDTLEINPIEE